MASEMLEGTGGNGEQEDHETGDWFLRNLAFKTSGETIRKDWGDMKGTRKTRCIWWHWDQEQSNVSWS